MLAEPSDAELLAGGPPEYFGMFYERHLDAVVAFLGGRVRRPELVFDLVAETFARALERREQFDPARGPAVAWLLAIARNLVIDAARRGQVASASRVRLAKRVGDAWLIVQGGRDQAQRVEVLQALRIHRVRLRR
jgi:RNA polymerase sigma factor (sigma-70 family)